LRLRKIVVERVTVVKFRVDNRGSDGTGHIDLSLGHLPERGCIGIAQAVPVTNGSTSSAGTTTTLHTG